jgi:hypothetical protein
MKNTQFYILALFVSLTLFDCKVSEKKNVNAKVAASKKKFTFVKVSRDVKKEAKRYIAEGWSVFPGNPPINFQLDLAFRRQTELDQEGFPQWIIANGSSVAKTQAAAEMQATELAKNRLVGLVETNMRSVIESDVSNNQLSAQEAVSLTKTIEVSANRVSKRLGRVQPLFKVIRSVKPTGNTEVQLLIGYNYDLVKKQLLDEAKVELQLETDDVRKRYTKFLNPENFQRGTIRNFADGTSAAFSINK